MNKNISIFLCFLFLTGCSTKSSYMKKGAIIGGVGTAITVGALGSSDPSTRHYSSAIAVVAIIMGLAGASLGAGVGYLIDEVSEDTKDKEMQEILQSEKIQGL